MTITQMIEELDDAAHELWRKVDGAILEASQADGPADERHEMCHHLRAALAACSKAQEALWEARKASENF